MPARHNYVKLDPHQLPDIKVPIPDDIPIGEGAETAEGMQNDIEVIGVYVPLIKINDKVIPWEDVISMSLKSERFLPELSLTVIDSHHTMAYLNTPGPDNKVYVEILPKPGIKTIKKIKMQFYITDVSSNTGNNRMSLRCRYYWPGLYESQIMSFGRQLSTRIYMMNVCARLGLGFLENQEGPYFDLEAPQAYEGAKIDPRYIYLCNESFHDSMIKETKYGGDAGHILDSWIDFWNYVNLIDLVNRCKVFDSTRANCGNESGTDVNGGLIEIPKMGNLVHMTDNKTDEMKESIMVPPVITNLYVMKNSPLYAESFTIVNDSYSNASRGTTRKIHIMDINHDSNINNLYESEILGSGKVSESTYVKNYYRGEYDGRFTNGQYLAQPERRDIFKQQIANNMIRVELKSPHLSIVRGNKIDVAWFDLDDVNKKAYESKNPSSVSKLPADVKSFNDNLGDYKDIVEDMDRDGVAVLNGAISGQYYIVAVEYKYSRTGGASEGGLAPALTQVLTLSKLDGGNYI